MSDITINNKKLNGTVIIPPSKSAAHRGIICAALTGSKCIVQPISLSKDMQATISCIKSLGCTATLQDGVLSIDAENIFNIDNAHLNCFESGSTLRFMLPVAALSGKKCTFDVDGRLKSRPVDELLNQMNINGVQYYKNSDSLPFPLTIEGKLCAGEYTLPGDVSSQYITGLLLALPLCNGNSTIKLTTPLQSKGYIDLTLSVMKQFGVNVITTKDGWDIPGNQHYIADSFTVEGDWSQSAFFMTAAALGGNLTLKGLDIDSVQGDKAVLDIYSNFGVKMDIHNDNIKLRAGQLKAQDIDASQIPDLVPAIAITAAVAEGTTRIYNAERLRLKESDRLQTTCDMINNLGGKCTVTDDGLIIEGVKQLSGGIVDGYNDHRIVMAAAVAASAATSDVTIRGYEAVSKSYPDFFDVLDSLTK